MVMAICKMQGYNVINELYLKKRSLITNKYLTDNFNQREEQKQLVKKPTITMQC